LLAVAGGLGLYSRHAWEEQQVAVEVTKLEREGSAAVELTKKRPLEGLLRAMRSGESLQQLMQRKRTSEYLTGSPVYALQQALETTKYQTLLAHPAAIKQMVVTPKGDRIITISDDHVVRTWNISGTLLHCFVLDESVDWTAKINSDGDIIATITHQGNIEIFNPSGELLRRIHLPSNQRSHLTFFDSTRDHIILSFISDERKYTTFTLNRHREIHARLLNTKVESINKKQELFLAISGKNVQMRDFFGNPIAKFTGHSEKVSGADFNSREDKVLTWSNDQTGKIWNLSGQLVHSFSGYQGFVSGVRLNKESNRVVTTNWSPSPYLWDISGELISKLEGHTNIAFAKFSDNGKYIATFSVDGITKIWDLSGKMLSEFKGHPTGMSVSGSVKDLAFLPTSNRVVTVSQDRTLRIWSWKEQFIAEQDKKHFSSGYIKAVTQPNRDRFVSMNHRCNLSSLVKQKNSYYMHPEGITKRDLNGKNNNFEDPKCGKIFDFFGNKISEILIPETETAWNDGPPVSLEVSQDGKYIIIRNFVNLELRYVFDWTGKLIKDPVVISKLRKEVRDPESNSSVNGMILQSSYSERRIDLLNSSKKVVTSIKTKVNGAKFSSSGKYILSFTNNPSAISLWTLSGKKIADLEGSSAKVDLNDERILTINEDEKTAKVWDTMGRLLSQYKSSTSIDTADFTSQGNSIVLITRSGEIKIHPIETLPQMLNRGCTWLRTYLKANPSELDQLPTCKAQYAKIPPKP
jgi:WD40 repeat protein